MNPSTPFSIYSLGDSAVTIDLGNCIDEQLNRRVLLLYDWLQAHSLPGTLDIIAAYSSVTIFYDLELVHNPAHVHHLLEKAWIETEGNPPAAAAEGRLIRIPVCYDGEYGPDLQGVARQKGLSGEELISLHCAAPYRVYMIGFLPGFPYMGRLDSRLEISRKDRPVPVTAGGVGIAGLQTGIYSLNSPGGWQIIGRTPVQLFDRQSDPPILLQTGDRVQFYPVSREEFDFFSLH